MPEDLPLFDVPTRIELRSWYREYMEGRYKADENVKRMVLEIVRGRRKLEEVAGLVYRTCAIAEAQDFERLSANGTSLRRASEILYLEVQRNHSTAAGKTLTAQSPSRTGAPEINGFDPRYDDDPPDDIARMIARSSGKHR